LKYYCLHFNEITFNNCKEEESIKKYKNKHEKRKQISVEWKVKEMRAL
jgi:hypothetical protein